MEFVERLYSKTAGKAVLLKEVEPRANGVSPSLLELGWTALTFPDTQRVTLTAHNTL